MKVGVHCHCPKCYSIPVRKRVRLRTPSITLLSLPEEVLLCVLQCISAEDLLSVRAVHSQLRNIVDNHASVWARANFRDTWPSPNNLWLFERAAEKGNFEAAVKLGIAYLYNEGPLLSDEGHADVCGRKASHFLSLAESLRSPGADPFSWLFIRPPWSPTGSCCKAVVFDRLKAECDRHKERKGPLLHCLARVLQLFEEEDKHAEAVSMLEESSRSGCLQSSYLIWEHNRKAAMSDPGRYLQCVRTLRDYAARGCWEAQVSLAKVCSSGNPLGLEAKACADLVSQLFRNNQQADQRGNRNVLKRGIKDTMRYILVDWLVEVTTMKDFSSLTLHVTVGCVDRYLALCSVPKVRLQLLGIACMVVCTRYMSKDILTIREAVWLTDNTYKYEDLVRMMGEVVSVLEGQVRSPTLLDYGEVLLSLLPLERRTTHLFSYICELSLLYSALATSPPPALACAALLLTRALHHYAPVWPALLVDYTGFSKQDLTHLAVLLYVKCFSQDSPTDYRHVSLTGVKQRFEDDIYQHISREKVMDYKELCHILEIPEVEPQLEPPSPTGQPADIQAFLASPSGTSKRRRDDGMQEDRGSRVTTPTAELSNQEQTLLGDILDWSLGASSSGYEGDQEESEGEKDGDFSTLSVKMEAETGEGTRENCRALSSDEESFSEDKRNLALRPKERDGLLFSVDDRSSGYSSVQSVSPSLSSSSSFLLVPCVAMTFPASPNVAASAPSQPGFRLLAPTPSPRVHSTKQVKRKNSAAHSRVEVGRGDDEDDEQFSADVGLRIL
ncbi:cyclin-F isoform X2 [Syngnathoides biaculeatus]|uniref:cyclin-F isoform X2 n=1 Tax=Syngnathoides biaculeatus TaxID=300417 RepID=UPI002ADE14B0|nr:cyclin-F isoform X2 [Syngnathoides biaculeatus]